MSAHVLVSAPPWAVAAIIAGAVVVALVFSGIARLVLRGRARLRWSVAILVSLLGIVVGLLIAEFTSPDARLGGPLPLVLSLGLAVLFTAVYGAIAAHMQRPSRASIEQLLRAGESGDVEYKSTARVNLRTGQKDDRMEQVIAKTVNAFLNGDGGTLLIGVDDAGTPLGLDADLATLRVPDLDRYELWLRDLLTTTLGPTAAARVEIDFAEIVHHDAPAPVAAVAVGARAAVAPVGVGAPVAVAPAGGGAPGAASAGEVPSAPGDAHATVCRLEVAASPVPVYLRSGKSAAPELWVRSGNSTRRLVLDEAADYIMHRWPLGIGANVAAQFRAAVRFSEDR